MSGIAGIIHFDGKPVDPCLIEKMTIAMAHRGPDGINHWVNGSVALGQCMLRTTPESLEEHLPTANEDESLVMVMDGRVDNWEELRQDLMGRGALLRNRSDAELVLRAFEMWGEECLFHIDGDFAFVIWDEKSQKIFCARDRIGNKPFNYYYKGNTFIFASELHAILLLPGVPQVLNEVVLAEYLANKWYSREETFWEGILRLVAAHSMIVDAQGNRIKKYWQPDLTAILPYQRIEDYVDHYRELLSDVVRRMSRSHKPVAYEVSGGLDSSAIFAMAEQLNRHRKLSTPSINGYSLLFHNDPDAQELKYSRAMAQHLKIKICEIESSQKPITWYRRWSKFYKEFPNYPNGVMAFNLREAARSDGCRTIISGVGGDEWLGMPWSIAYFAEEISSKQWGKVCQYFKEDCQDLGIRKTVWLFTRHGLIPLLPAVIKKNLNKLLGARENESWLSDNLQRKLEERYIISKKNSADKLFRRGQSRQIMILEAPYDALARELEERFCSSLMLDLRKPYCNEKIIQFAFSTPERFRSRGYTTKWLHRQAMKDLLPKLVLNRATKADFMGTFSKQLDTLKKDLIVDIIPRRDAWLKLDRALVISKDYKDTKFAGWSEWWLWTLIGCDAVINDLDPEKSSKEIDS